MKTENEISYIIRGAIYNAYKELGPGLLELTYETVLKHILEKDGLSVQSQVPIALVYKNIKLDIALLIHKSAFTSVNLYRSVVNLWQSE